MKMRVGPRRIGRSKVKGSFRPEHAWEEDGIQHSRKMEGPDSREIAEVGMRCGTEGKELIE